MHDHVLKSSSTHLKIAFALKDLKFKHAHPTCYVTVALCIVSTLCLTSITIIILDHTCMLQFADINNTLQYHLQKNQTRKIRLSKIQTVCPRKSYVSNGDIACKISFKLIYQGFDCIISAFS